MYAQYKEQMSQVEGRVYDAITLPWEVIDACNGFALDIGGSVMKFLYIDKNNWRKKEERNTGASGQLCVQSFPHTDFVSENAFDFIKANVYINKTLGQPPLIFGTGVGTAMLGTKFNEEFGVQVKCEEESTCFTRALSYSLKKLPRKDVLLRIDSAEEESIIAEGKSTFQTTMDTKKMLGIRTANQNPVSADGLWFSRNLVDAAPDQPLAAENDMFPCILVMCGSATGAMLVYEDGTYDIINDVPIGGKYWLGLGSVLTNAQNYNQLMALAESGNNEVVDMTQADFMDEGGEGGEGGDFYQDLADKSDMQFARTVFSFAKVNPQNRDTFKKEDVARAFLNAMTTDMVALGMGAGRIARARHVFYSGGFVSHHLVQNMMYRHWVRAWSELAGYDTQMEPVEIHFLKHSAHLGALGALLATVEQNS